MRKLLFALIILMSASSISFAQTPAAPAAPTVIPAAAETKGLVFTGKVDAVILADAAKGVKPGIVLVDEKGVKTPFLVGPETTLVDAAGKAIILEQIAKDQMVMVSYGIKDGVNGAVSVTEMK